MTLPQVDDLTAGPFVAEGSEVAIFDQYRDKLDIRTPGWRQLVGNLSGGNQQKIVIGKWLSMHPNVLIVDGNRPIGTTCLISPPCSKTRS